MYIYLSLLLEYLLEYELLKKNVGTTVIAQLFSMVLYEIIYFIVPLQYLIKSGIVFCIFYTFIKYYL